MSNAGALRWESATSARAASAPMGNSIAYDPNRLLDALIDRLSLKNDAALAAALEVAPPVISKIRHFRLPVGASMLINMEEESGLSIRELKKLLGLPVDVSFAKSMAAVNRDIFPYSRAAN